MSDEDEIEAFSRFYRKNVARLVTFLVLQGTPAADAADCVQETMIKALPPMWATLEHPYAWCRQVAYRKSCKLRRAREVLTDDVERVGAALTGSTDALDAIDQDLEIRRLLLVVQGERQRAVLAWTYDGATPTEIAAELKMTPATVRSTLRNARLVIRTLYDTDLEVR